MLSQLVTNHLLNKKIILNQPKNGYRISSDSVIFAASCDKNIIKSKRKAHNIIELGCGTGGVMLVHHYHHRDDTIIGIEIDTLNCKAAQKNIIANHADDKLFVMQADIHQLPLNKNDADIVLMNPPWYGRDWSPPQNPRKSKALNMTDDIKQWINAASYLLKDKGYLHMLIRSEDLLITIAALLSKNFGGLQILPLYSFANKPAHRFIINARKASHEHALYYRGLIIHEYSLYHQRAPYSQYATSILNGDISLSWHHNT